MQPCPRAFKHLFQIQGPYLVCYYCGASWSNMLTPLKEVSTNSKKYLYLSNIDYGGKFKQVRIGTRA